MKQFILPLLFIVIAYTSYGQSHKRAKIYLENHLVLKTTNLEINNNNIGFLNKANGKRESVALSKVSLIKIPKGNYVLEGALFGAGTFALTALLIDVDPNPLLDKKRDTGFYLGYTAVGTLIGGLVGVLIPKWKSIYSGGKFFGANGPMNFDFGVIPNQVTIKISITL